MGDDISARVFREPQFVEKHRSILVFPQRITDVQMVEVFNRLNEGVQHGLMKLIVVNVHGSGGQIVENHCKRFDVTGVKDTV